MIDMLESDDPAERIVAIQGLESMTGQTFEYDHAADPAARRKAVDRWRAWYAEQTARGTTPGSTSEPGKAARP